jgi:hypothetical protein
MQHSALTHENVFAIRVVAKSDLVDWSRKPSFTTEDKLFPEGEQGLGFASG